MGDIHIQRYTLLSNTGKTLVRFCTRLYVRKILYIDFKFDGLYISLVIAVVYICGQLHTMTVLLCARTNRSVFAVLLDERKTYFTQYYTIIDRYGDYEECLE